MRALFLGLACKCSLPARLAIPIFCKPQPVCSCPSTGSLLQPILRTVMATGSSPTPIPWPCQPAFTASFYRSDLPCRQDSRPLCFPASRPHKLRLPWLPPKGAPLVISKPVTSLRSLSRPHAGPFPYGTGLAKRCVPLPAFEIPKRALKLGAPAAPDPCAKGRVLWNPVVTRGD